MDIVQQLWEKAYFPFFESIVKRRNVVRLYRELADSQWLDIDELESRQLADINNLLTQAKTYVPFYRDNPQIPWSVATIGDLALLPTLTKHKIRSNRDSLITTDQTQRSWWKSTGGSTGEPLRFAHTPHSHDWRTAISLRGYSWAGAHPGTKQAYIWGGATSKPSVIQSVKALLHRRLERKTLFDCLAFTPDAMKKCYESLRKLEPDVLIGYTNPTYELAQFIEREKLAPLDVSSVLCAAEKLFPTQRTQISRSFNCDVFDTYGSREFMLIASECSEHKGLHVSMENLVVEVVDKDGKPTAPGDIGRILITDLHNFAMPFIRYEIGDLARVGERPCNCGRGLPVLDEIIGRNLDVIRSANGTIVAGELFPHVMKDFPDVQRYRVVQESASSIKLSLQCEVNDPARLSDAVRQKLDRVIGGEFEIDIEFVDTIAVSPRGKHRMIVSKLSET